MQIRNYLHDNNIFRTLLHILIVTIILAAITPMGSNSLLTTATTHQSLNSGNGEVNTATPITVNVLIYNGKGVIPSSVNGIKKCFEISNKKNLASNVYFNYSTTKKINSKTLSGYNVLIIPGGIAETYLQNPEINVKDLKRFVSKGNGYVGICAGSYVASSHVDGYYDGWGIAPHVHAKSADYVGPLFVSITANGRNILNSSNKEIMYHWNGPAMYETGSVNNSLALYANNETGYQGYVAITNDTYGSGRVILFGSHPELNPQKPETLVNMILWTFKQN